MKKGKVLKTIYTGIFYITAIFMAVFITVQIINPEQSVDWLGFNIYVIADTGSMEPMLRHNDLIIVRKADFHNLQAGDVISFMGNIRTRTGAWIPAPITHKIVDETTAHNGEKAFHTQGINPATNPNRDLQPVTISGADGANRYIGKFAFRIPHLGWLINFLRSTYGAIVIGVNVVIYLIIKFFKDAEEEQTEEAC